MARKIEYAMAGKDQQDDEKEEALEDLLDLVRALKSSGLLDMIKAMAERKNDIMSILAKEASEERNRRLLQNVLLIYTMLSSLDTEILNNIAHGVEDALNGSRQQREHGGLSLIKVNAMMKSPEVAAGIRVLFSIIGSLGGGKDENGGK
ncbi:DUF1641 domain-containing protein [Thermoplasma sp.]|uniref:DUF1641 domain-containing protein n=1 Tax=Thermoplasma sp. TaxID=1973142 RepID=UPI00127A1B21|nr:DUF1641 domain-containing protein [Thermoplasma sp.]KAA8922439.1 MAG: DUF1641 domain-containing protein [Thermoplasma sp.]